jgi:hypothetical protein
MTSEEAKKQEASLAEACSHVSTRLASPHSFSILRVFGQSIFNLFPVSRVNEANAGLAHLETRGCLTSRADQDWSPHRLIRA